MRWRWLALLPGAAVLLAAAELALRARYRNRVLPSRPASFQAEPRKAVVVALGDSITAGGPDAAWPALLQEHLRSGYPQVAWKVVNAGVPGDTAPLGYARFDRDAAAAGPQLVLIAFGLNDCNPARHAMDRWYEARVPSGPASSYLWRAMQARIERLGRWALPMPELTPQPFPRTSPAGFSAALAALVARSEVIGARPVLLTMTPLAREETPGVQALRGVYGAYNERIRKVALRYRQPLVDLSDGVPDDAFEPDGFHLTASGQRWAAERIYEPLAVSGVWAALAKEKA